MAAVPIMHWDGDLRLELCQHVSRQVRVHGAPPANRCQGDVDFAERFNLLFVELLTQISEVGDAQISEIETKAEPWTPSMYSAF